jgi:aspartyl-tRNA(Asn)/glutamyl-tRNA(Gln) amidotransferase subunit B
MHYEPVIGIEVHAQLKTKTKLFCACSTNFGASPNTNVCPICLGMPGTLPVLNKKAVEFAIMAGLALNCQINKTSVFARKNYFYPDMPKDYQISQFEFPICGKGYLDIEVDGKINRIGITRIHMEEDAGKLVHQGSASITGSLYSLVDLNRASTPLIEIVSEPDIRSGFEASIYVESLKYILQYLGICDGNLEEGSFRADANVSLRPVGETKLGTKAEIKNLNSFKSIKRAINIEIERQTELLNSGQKVIQQTRNYDEANKTTTPLRTKEESNDYRYFPEPDLMPLVITEKEIADLKNALPELPAQKIKRYQEIGLKATEINILLNDLDMNQYFDKCLGLTTKIEPAEFCKWIIGDFNSLVKEQKIKFADSPITPQKLCELLEVLKSGQISIKMAKDLLIKINDPKTNLTDLLKNTGMAQISDQNELDGLVEKVIAANPDVVEKIKAGKTASANFLMGQIMKETKGQANPDMVLKLILGKIPK